MSEVIGHHPRHVMRHTLFLLFCLAGCSASSSESVTTPSGKPGFSVECAKDYCADEAQKRCPAGYNVEEKKDFEQTYGRRGGDHPKERWIIACR